MPPSIRGAEVVTGVTRPRQSIASTTVAPEWGPITKSRLPKRPERSNASPLSVSTPAIGANVLVSPLARSSASTAGGAAGLSRYAVSSGKEQPAPRTARPEERAI